MPAALLRPRLVFGPLSRWQQLCGGKSSTAAVRGDSIILGLHAHSTAADRTGAAKQALRLARAVPAVAKASD